MRRCEATLLGFLALLAAAAHLPSQEPTVESLQEEVKQLRRQMEDQRRDFEARIRRLQGQVDTELEEELDARIEDIVATKSMFFSRPRPGSTAKRSLFTTLQGGLIFTGLFRTRFEARANNVDFNGDDDGLDDEGVRVNGRFRLGFGTVLIGGFESDPSGPQVSALTEFQSVGNFADNSFVNIPGPGGLPLPTPFNILTEPFEEVRLYQGYLHFERLLHDDIYVKAGRQEMTFGNEFVMGNNSHFSGTTHDAILVEWVQDNLRISGWYAKEAASDSNLVSGLEDFDEDQFTGLYGTLDVTEDVVLDAYALYFDARSVDSNLFVTGSTAAFLDGTVTPFMKGHFWTFGARAFWTRIEFLDGYLTANAEAAFQTGSNGIDASFAPTAGGIEDQSIHGWAGEIILNWRISPSGEGLRPILTLAYYYAGGGEKNELSPTGSPLTDIGFQPLFINRHFDIGDRDDVTRPYYPGGGRYGNMDLVPLSNVHLGKLGLSVAPLDDVELGLVYVLAVVADDEGYGTGLFGHEADLYGAYEYNEHLQFSANLSVFLPDDPAEDLSNLLFFGPGNPGEAGDDAAFLFYLQALISF